MPLFSDYVAVGQAFLDDYEQDVNARLAQAAVDLETSRDALAQANTALQALRSQYDAAVIRTSELTASLNTAQARVTELQAQVAGLTAQNAILLARIAELEAGGPPTPPVTIKVGSAPLGSSLYPLPTSNFVTVSTVAQFNTALAGTAATIVMRQGNYNVQSLRITRAVTIQNYPGEVVVFDGSTFTDKRHFAIFKAKVTLRGVGIRKYGKGSEQYSGEVVLPDGCNGSMLENVVIEDMGGYALNIFNNDGVILRCVSVFRSPTNHLGTDRVTNLLVDRVYFKDANTSGGGIGDTVAAIKVTRSPKTVTFLNCVIDGAPNVGGIWFDWSCQDMRVINCDIINTGLEQIQFEAVDRGLAIGNYCRGLSGSKYGIRSYISSRTRIYNNDVAGAGNYQILVSQDDRPKSGQEPTAAEKAAGMDWIAKEVEVVNNVFGTPVGPYYYQFGTEGTRTAEQMLSKVEANQFPGTSNNIAWNQGNPPARVNETVAQMDSRHPNIARGNGPAPTPSVIPDELCDLMGVPRGSKFTGIGRPRHTLAG